MTDLPERRSLPSRVVTNATGLTLAAQLLVDFNEEFDDPVPETPWLANRLISLVEEGNTSVLVTGDPPVGIAVLRFRPNLWKDGEEAYLAEFYVQPALRGQGIGTAFLDDIIDHARSRGATYMDLNTSEADHAARHVYEKRGFDCHEGRGRGPTALYYELNLS